VSLGAGDVAVTWRRAGVGERVSEGVERGVTWRCSQLC